MTERTMQQYDLGTATEVPDRIELEIPLDSTPMTVKGVRQIPRLFVLQDMNWTDRVKRVFRLFNTGNPIESTDNLDYIGSAELGPVWVHVFEEVQQEAPADDGVPSAL